jgi:hypothetical protein
MSASPLILTRAERSHLLGVRPRTSNQLREWLRLALDVDTPRGPLLEGSSSPFEYLCHSFFEWRAVDIPIDCVVWACRGGGKTFYASVATLLDMLFKPGVDVRILGGSIEQSRRMHEHLRRFFERPELARLLDAPMTQKRVLLRNGSRAEVLAQSETSVRGCRPQVLRCDEVELFDPDVWRAAQLVTRSAMCGDTLVRGRVEALSTMHRAHGLMADLTTDGARRVFRWGVVDVLARCEPERECAPCDLAGECAGRAKRAGGHIAVDDAIALKRRSDVQSWRSEMLCLSPRRDDLVYPEFSRAVHVFEEDWPRTVEPDAPAPVESSAVGDGPLAAAGIVVRARRERGFDPALLWIGGMDFGFRAPTVILFGAVDASGVLRIVDERVERAATLDVHVDAMLGSHWPRARWIGVDPAGNQRALQTGASDVGVLRKRGLIVRDRRVSVEAGIRLVRARLAPASGSPTLFIHARCVNLIESLERYHYRDEGSRPNEPVKDGADHAADALRYLVQNLDLSREERVGRYW